MPFVILQERWLSGSDSVSDFGPYPERQTGSGNPPKQINLTTESLIRNDEFN
jgi:hypothetical protein